MIYFTPIKIKIEDKIREFAISDIENRKIKMPYIGQYAVDHIIPENLLSEINQELNSIDFPDVLYAKSYVRKKDNFQGLHIDSSDGIPVHCAINIPLKGCDNSKHMYLNGSYEKIQVAKNNLTFSEIVWKSAPNNFISLNLTSPHLLRVDEPHSAVGNGNEERWVFTMRFQGNPTFEELYDKLNKKGSTT